MTTDSKATVRISVFVQHPGFLLVHNNRYNIYLLIDFIKHLLEVIIISINKHENYNGIAQVCVFNKHYFIVDVAGKNGY